MGAVYSRHSRLLDKQLLPEPWPGVREAVPAPWGEAQAPIRLSTGPVGSWQVYQSTRCALSIVNELMVRCDHFSSWPVCRKGKKLETSEKGWTFPPRTAQSSPEKCNCKYAT